MRRAKVALFLAVAVAGCGGDEPSMEDRLQGQWATRDADGCAISVAFDSGSAEVDYICALDDGSIGVQARVYDYAIHGAELELRMRASSCHGDLSGTVTYAFAITEADMLSMTTPAATWLLSRVDQADTRGGVFDYGCFTGDVFTAHPVLPL